MITTAIGLVIERSCEVNYKFCMSWFCDALLTPKTGAAVLNVQAKDGLTVRGVHPDGHQLRNICDSEKEPLEGLSKLLSCQQLFSLNGYTLQGSTLSTFPLSSRC